MDPPSTESNSKVETTDVYQQTRCQVVLPTEEYPYHEQRFRIHRYMRKGWHELAYRKVEEYLFFPRLSYSEKAEAHCDAAHILYLADGNQNLTEQYIQHGLSYCELAKCDADGNLKAIEDLEELILELKDLENSVRWEELDNLKRNKSEPGDERDRERENETPQVPTTNQSTASTSELSVQPSDDRKNATEVEPSPFLRQEADINHSENQPDNDGEESAEDRPSPILGRENADLENLPDIKWDDTIEEAIMPALEPNTYTSSRPDADQPTEDEENPREENVSPTQEPEKGDKNETVSQAMKEALRKELAPHYKKQKIALYQCKVSECIKEFKRSNFCEKHISNRHPLVVEEGRLESSTEKINVKVFRCQAGTCTKNCLDYEAWEEHFKEVHPRWYKSLMQKVEKKEKRRRARESRSGSLA